MDPASQIADIIHKRNESVQPLLREEERCGLTLSILDKLQADIAKFTNGKDEADPTVQNCATFYDNIPRIRQRINSLRESINNCRRRFERNTINIGFGGKRGQGKSFLLQKFSGLSDNEVPSGSGKTVTAVRSEIFNDPSAYAEITFYDKPEFLQEVVTPYCNQLDISAPTSLAEFASLDLPQASEIDELKVSYLNKLRPLRDHVDKYEGLLTGETIRETDFSKLRQYVAYTDKDHKDSYIYAAVKSVQIHTPFPETNVRQLGLIDLPGLGELNPTVETRHTKGFGDEVDLVMLIRRPYGTRVDWDHEDQKALETLKGAIKDGSPTDFVVIVQNEGGCEPALAETAIESIRKTISDKFTVLRTKGENSKTLSDDVLQPILEHLAKTLPIADKKALDAIQYSSARLWKVLGQYSRDALDILKKLNDRGGFGEKARDKAVENRDHLARLLEESVEELNQRIVNSVENEQLVEQIEAIQSGLGDYVRSGLGAGSVDAWISRNADRISRDKNIAGVFTNTAHELRVRIAEDFATLDAVYTDMVNDLLDVVAGRFDEVLPNFLQGENGRQKLEFFRDRLEKGEWSFDNICEALDFLLHLKIEHRTQIYPRAYEPVRNFMKYVADNKNFPDVSALGREEQARTVFNQLSGVADRVVIEIVDRLNEETLRINDILFVALEFFDDKLIRSQSAERHWERFIEEFYPEIYGSREEASNSFAIGAIMAKMNELKSAVN